MRCDYKSAEAKKAESYLEWKLPCRHIDDLYKDVDDYSLSLGQVEDLAWNVARKAQEKKEAVLRREQEVRNRLEDVKTEIANTPTVMPVSHEEIDRYGNRQTKTEWIPINQGVIASLEREKDRLENELSRLVQLYNWLEEILRRAQQLHSDYHTAASEARTSASSIMSASSILNQELDALKSVVNRAVSAMEEFNAVRVQWNKTHGRGLFKYIGDK